MHPSTFLSTALLLTLTTALPLNINLGAYSPALVVGDGAIEFEGGEATEAAASTPVAPNAQQPQPQTLTKRLLHPQTPYHPLPLSGRSPTPFDIPSTLLPPIPPPIPVPISPPIPVPPGPPDPDPETLLPPITPPIPVPISPPIPVPPPAEPHDVPNPDPTVPKSNPDLKTKRQAAGDGGLAGFDRALQFAEVALTKGPDIQLGTGTHGAGVGMIVDNNQGSDAESIVVPFPAGGGAQPAPTPGGGGGAGGGGGEVSPAGGGLVPPLAPGGGEIPSGGRQGVVVVGRPG